MVALRGERDGLRNRVLCLERLGGDQSTRVMEQATRAKDAERQRDEAVGLLRKFNEAWRSGCGWLPAMNSLDDEIAAFLANQGADQ